MTKTLFLGMDGSTFTILNELTSGDNPVMPFMAQIFKQGARGKLLSTPNPLTPPAWVSLMTGRSPGNHGLYDFLKTTEVGGELYTELYSATDCQVEMIWSIASRQGKRVAALNLPFTAPPPRDINGVILPGFIPWKHLRRNTQPKDFYTSLKENLPGFDPKELAWDFEREEKSVQHLTDEERKNWVIYHLPREEQWFNVAKYVLQNENTDLMAVMFDGTDKLQHQIWRFIAPGLEPAEPDAYYDEMREISLKYFSLLDGYLKDLIETAGEDTQVFMASDHGFTTQYEAVRINSYLKEKGYLKYKDNPDPTKSDFLSTVDVSKSIAYCKTSSSNGINIRIARTAGETGVKPEEYKEVREKLIYDLEQLVDKDTGERIITDITVREEAFPGLAMGEAPDLLLTLRDHGFVSTRDELPVVQKLSQPIGTHHPEGVFIAYGPGIKKGVVIEDRNIVDVAATLLYSVGLPVPSDFEGQVPTSVFTEEYLKENPIRIGAETLPPVNSATKDMSPEEKQSLLAQLSALGYAE
ncbi:MAG: alkaline phosphatase family protein [Rickettsiales bacterium]|nr:alkaline phosphatase family protein [Pseudomonadota bacterium]MDA0965419.1 alkaline phosphatase family protein [Pseudomonadota bacterium]MDG4542744.1 alkaline phosphatase family protein [Rickettsiales bacterium]MDG4544808.1 alkaline phosphatase family protein [Rickettsiales bacterium]MDG4546930.1 alkaline phosphatase family protein [Rickettsiales bacterium]